MTDRTPLQVAKWPFLLGNALFLALAYWIMLKVDPFITLWQTLALFLCVAAGASLSITPFVWEHKAALRLAESESLSGTLRQIQNLESIAAQIQTATGQWQGALDSGSKVLEAARQMNARMDTEAAAFADFFKQADEKEKGHLRLEVEKLRRAEADWLQVVVRLLDHVYNLQQAGVRSGKPELAENFTRFQAACRDVTRRVGLVPVEAAAGTLFDEKLHQLMEESAAPAPGTRIVATIATGYTYQGQSIRLPIVALQSPGAGPAAPTPA
jgi:molecular chaperone GrpE (heat shock protein)